MKIKNVNADCKNEYKFMRCMSETNYCNFNDELNQLSWNDIYSITDVNEAYEKFMVIVKELYDKHFPLKQIKVKGKKNT